MCYRMITIATCLAVFLTAGVCFAQSDSGAIIHPPVWDYGYLPQKSEVTHDFYICNTGSAPITIARIESGCSCTSVSDVDDPIAPGDSVAIAVTFKSGRYQKKVKKTTKVYLEGDNKPVLKHRVESYVFKNKDETGDITVEPGKLEWKIDGSEPMSLCDTLNITNNTPDTLNISIAHTAGVLIYNVEHPDNLPPGQNARIVMTARQLTSLAETKGLSATFLLTGQDTTRITVPIEIDD